MGVDAEMFVRIRGRENWLKAEDERKAAYELASTLGPGNFMITLGSWPNKPQWEHHALSIMRPINDADDAEDNGVQSAYVGRVVWTQDGDPIVADEDEQFVRIHLYTSYYGEEYARGNWPIIRAAAEWCEVRFPGAEVWYGGDSSGICAAPLTRARRDELNTFYLKSGRKTYTRYMGGALDTLTGLRCQPCPRCAVDLINCGGGSDSAFFCCDGCGHKAIVSSSGTQWLKPHDDFFEVGRARRQQGAA